MERIIQHHYPFVNGIKKDFLSQVLSAASEYVCGTYLSIHQGYIYTPVCIYDYVIYTYIFENSKIGKKYYYAHFSSGYKKAKQHL